MKNHTLKLSACLCVALLGASVSMTADAQRGGVHGGVHGGGGGHGGEGWHGGGGRGWRGGGLGWWGPGLGLGLGWGLAYPYYGYPYSAYPYPYPYFEYDEPDVSPAQVVPSAPPPTASWYYCDSAKDYYPRVAQCPEPWRTVPAVPPGTAQ